MSKIRTRLIQKHDKDCAAVDMWRRGYWHSPWCDVPVSHHWLNYWGTAKGNSQSHIWIEFQCNSPQCGACVLVHVDDITSAISNQ